MLGTHAESCGHGPMVKRFSESHTTRRLSAGGFGPRSLKERVMKITLEYLVDDDHNERDEAAMALNVVDYSIALWNIEQELRRLWKYVQHDYEETEQVIDGLCEFVANEVSRLPGYDR